MTEIDQFESTFKSADKPPYRFEPVRFNRILVITDMDLRQGKAFAEQIKSDLGNLPWLSNADWNVTADADFDGVASLLAAVERDRPDLIFTYRNLRIDARDYPHSLGVYVDVLTQATDVPVLLLPHPKLNNGDQPRPRCSTENVMAITDHLAGEHHMVSVAAHVTKFDGTLWLTHVEDEAVFNRYIATIGKIPEIDTDQARTMIQRQLLKEPRDYIASARAGLKAHGLNIQIQEVVTMGHSLGDYRRLIKEHQIDLLVMNTKEDDQLAMHGVAYALSVELRDLPLLML